MTEDGFERNCRKAYFETDGSCFLLMMDEAHIEDKIPHVSH